LGHGGFGLVAGVDEAGRGACAGPLVVGAVIMRPGRRGEIEGLADSKLLTPRRREEIYAQIVARAMAWSAVVIPCHDIDKIGLHRCNIAGMRRAVTMLETRPGYVLSDGFPVPGLDVPALAVTKGDRIAACIAAASVVAKVTRDRLMVELHGRFPAYGFDVHKGYITREHQASLATYGPCPEHRFSFVNIARLRGAEIAETVADQTLVDRALVDGALVDGTVADGTVADGAWVDGALVNGSVVDGSFVDEALVDEALADGALVDGATEGRTPDGGRQAVEAGMQDNGAGAVGGTDGYGAALEGVAEQAGVA
jgi:ribonuclease HII